MRSHKQQGNSPGRFFTPTVNSYKLHIAAVKSLLPERILQRPFDLRFSKDLTKANVDVLRANPPRQDNRLPVYCRPLHVPVLALMNEFVGPGRALLPPPTTVPAGLFGDFGAQARRGKKQRSTWSAGAIYSHSKDPLIPHSVNDERYPPVFPVSFCSRDDCSTSLERLELDCRGLIECPSLYGMDNLRLLNLQHNLISHLPHLAHLPRLAFFDLYDNRLTDMSAISSLSLLRVLVLGKNRIQRICGLDNLTRLDVLDLHSNQSTSL